MTPLAKRLPRELKTNLGKYIGIFALMVVTITMVSGFLVSASSILAMVDEIPEKYNVEDGRFVTNFEASDKAIAAAEKCGIKVYENFSMDLGLALPRSTEESRTARVYANRTTIDLPAYSAGRAPEVTGEIALDRVFCQNNNLAVGDTVTLAGQAYTLVGIVTLSDYQALFEDNDDFVFNGLTFTITQVTAEQFAALEDAGNTESFTYSFQFDERGLDLAARLDRADDIAEALTDNGCVLSDYLDIESNQAYGYASDDAEGDSLMYEVMMGLLIVIMAFVFFILTRSTIEQESAVIGTLMASGYRKREIIGHYMAMPTIVGLVACVVGNVLGYAFVIDAMSGLYYNSYSYPPFEARFDLGVYLFTTVLPFVLLELIMFIGLVRVMRATPLMFLRYEAAGKKRKRGMALPERMPFMSRFTLRVISRNIANFIILFLGILLASLLLLFGFCMMPTVDSYAEGMKSDLVAEHLYTLKSPLEIEGTAAERSAWAAVGTYLDEGGLTIEADTTATELVDKLGVTMKASSVDTDGHPVNSVAVSQELIDQAEKFGAYTLEITQSSGKTESVTIYGVQEDSRYWTDLDVSGGRIVMSNGLADKYGIAVGSTVALDDKYTNDSYELAIADACGSINSICVYMSLETFNELFGNDADYFNGYASDEELPLDARYVSSDLTPAAMDSIVAQMENSMGNVMGMMVGLAVIIYVVLMYLLTKTVIDRSARPISYMKVFGYRNREINRLYVNPISIAVVVSLIVSLPVVIASIAALMKIVFMEYSGNFAVATPAVNLAEVLVVGVVCYAVVAFIHTRRIKKVSLALALKVQE